MLWRGIEHERGVMGSAIASFGREERSFDVPAGDRCDKFGMLLAKFTKTFEAADELAPVVRDEREEKAAARGLGEGLGGRDQCGGGEVIALEIGPRETIDLNVDEDRGEPREVGCGRGGLEVFDAVRVPGEFDWMAGRIVSGDNRRHGRVWGGEGRGGKIFEAVEAVERPNEYIKSEIRNHPKSSEIRNPKSETRNKLKTRMKKTGKTILSSQFARNPLRPHLGSVTGSWATERFGIARGGLDEKWN
jgi:hypothetical protein